MVDNEPIETLELIYIPVQEKSKSNLPEWFQDELRDRKAKYLSGQSKSYSWEQVKSAINDL